LGVMVNLKLFLLLFLFLFPLMTQADVEPSLGDLLPLYTIEEIQGTGDVQVSKEGKADWKNTKEGLTLEEGDHIRVGRGTEVILRLKNDTFVHMDEDSELEITRLSENESQGFLSRLKLLVGSILSDVKKNLPDTHSSFEVESGGVVCGVRGTVFEVAKTGDNVETTTHEGVVNVKSSQGTQSVKAGNSCTSSKNGGSSVHPSSAAMQARFRAWNKIRHHLAQKHAGKTGRSPKLGRSPSHGGGKGPGSGAPNHIGGHR
jgi:hypothetical protein